MNRSDRIAGLRGMFRLKPDRIWSPNTIMADYAVILGNLLRGDRRYRAALAYIEFENVDNPGDPASAISYGFTEDVSYYTGLSSSLNRDYLRVPFILGEPELDDTEAFPKGNLVRGYGRSNGSTGVHGKPFSSGANSVVCGVAIVASPAPEDATQDLILSRWYAASEDEQWAKETGQEVTAEWQLVFGQPDA